MICEARSDEAILIINGIASLHSQNSFKQVNPDLLL